ncbi:MAG: GMC family oxidoreductase, partial [Bacteroidota bacterium]
METKYDAIVVGSGITGGWAAKELCQKGLKTLVLERGRDVKHVQDYPTMNMTPWEFKYRGYKSQQHYHDQAVQTRTYAFNEGTKHFFVNDLENPYTEVKKFSWIRGYHVGGRSLMWARQSYRLSDLDFTANAKDGFGVDWPIRYKDIAPWYDYVEKFIGVNGSIENIPQLPDGQFLPPMEMNCVEKEVKKGIESNFADRRMIMGRSANLTRNHNGRNKCNYRNLCYRGCPYGAYFSSNSATLPAAYETGNLTLRPHSIVHSIIYDEQKDKATGVRVIDAQSNEALEFEARVIFLCASTLGSTTILLNSATPRFSDGLANSSGALGHYLMDHHFQIGAEAEFEGFEDQYYSGRRPNGIYIPRFRNVKEQHPDFVRGYGYQGGASRKSWYKGMEEGGFGKEFKDSLSKPGGWTMRVNAFGECLPYKENKVSLNKDKTDKWGIPTLDIDCEFRDNEKAMRK